MTFRCGLLMLMLLAVSGALAAGEKLDADMRALEQARDLAGMQARISEAEADELDSPEAWNWRAWLALAENGPDEAEALLEQGLKAFPDSAALELQQTALMVRGFNDVGNLGAMRLARRVRQGFERAVELGPDHVGARVALIMYYINAPRIAGGGEARAREHIDQLKQLSPAAYYDMQAIQASANGDREQALELVEQARAREDSAERRLNRGLILQALEDYPAARSSFRTIVEEYPTHGAAWYQLGRTSVLAEDWIDEGQEALQRFMALPTWPGDPSHAAAWWRLGQLHALAEDTDAALGAFERSLALDADFEPAANALADLSARAN